MALHDVLDDGQSESRAAHLSGAALVETVEPLEESVEKFFGDARSVVHHLQNRVVLFTRPGNRDGGLVRAVFDRIVHEIGQDLLKSFWICMETWRLDLGIDRGLFCLRKRLKLFDHVLGDFGEIQIGRVEFVGT